MSRSYAWHWHRFVEWVRDLLAARAFARGRHHYDCARAHGAEADRIRPPAGPAGRTPAERPAPEWAPRLTARDQHTDLHPPPGA